MKQERFSAERIVAVPKQAELGMSAADLIRKSGISEQTCYRWKKLCAGLQSDQVRELKQLQEEDLRLKRLVAECSLDKVALPHSACPRPAKSALRSRAVSGLVSFFGA